MKRIKINNIINKIMTVKKQKQMNKKVTLVSEWKHQGLKRMFMKFGLIFILCVIGFDISAQITVQNAIADTQLNDTVTIGSYKWYVVRKKDNQKVSDSGIINVPGALCVGSVMMLSSTEEGGIWSSSNSNIATIDPSTGEITGVSDGEVIVSYKLPENRCESFVTITVGKGAFVWTPKADSDEEKHNWYNPKNWTPAEIPSACSNVYIPGNSTHFPKLTSWAECRDIYFISGAELGRPDFLIYEKAHVQYNFGLLAEVQMTERDVNDFLIDTSSDERMLNSAPVSSAPIERERWYMLSSPLHGVLTGDLGFGGFPLTFLMKFGPIEKDGMNYSVGKWTTPYTSMTESTAALATDGFAFYMYGYDEDDSEERNLGCMELGLSDDLNDSDYFPNRGEESEIGFYIYGLERVNGILELPFFADSTMLYAHRTQVYDNSSNTSTFYNINDGINDPSDFNKLTGEKASIPRMEHDGNYRFAADIYMTDTESWTFRSSIPHPTNGLNDGDEFLVGNPYMSSIDMVKFFEDNAFSDAPSIHPSFRIWDGNEFITCEYDEETGKITSTDGSDMNYIAPSQSFFLQSTGSGKDVLFNVKNISTVRPARSAFNLRSDRETREENLLRIKAENRFAASYAIIGHKEGADNGYVRGEDVEKLFSLYNRVPSVYSLANDVPTDINFINSNGDVTVPLGIKTEQTGETRLTFTGMDNYDKASKIEFIDALEGRTVNLTGKSNYTYTFDNTEKGIQNGRFLLRIGTSMTALPDVTSSDHLKVYGNSKGIFVISSPSDPVLQVIVYDFQGRKIYESASGAEYYPLEENSAHSPLIVKVMTKSQVKSVKIN